jgi:GNAT superfamily N-acetyltransferase
MLTLTRLTDADRPQIAAHLLRLEPEARRRRFGSALKDGCIADYAGRIDPARNRLLGFFAGGELRGLAEIFPELDGASVEAAFSVDRDWRGRGICTELMDRVLRWAGCAGYGRVTLYIQQANRPMREVARKHGFRLSLDAGEYVAERVLAKADPVAQLREIVETVAGANRRARQAYEASAPRRPAPARTGC